MVSVSWPEVDAETDDQGLESDSLFSTRLAWIWVDLAVTIGGWQLYSTLKAMAKKSPKKDMASVHRVTTIIEYYAENEDIRTGRWAGCFWQN